jgi:hypothetical protein
MLPMHWSIDTLTWLFVLESKVILASLVVHRLLARSVLEGDFTFGVASFNELFIDLGLGQAGIRSFQRLHMLVVLELVASHSSLLTLALVVA